VLLQYQALGEGPVAVRSSALGEDSEDASFAGQYDTILNVVGPDALRAAIDACLASADNERARAYREARAATEQDGAVAMTVVVQRMVDAQSAGVLFTADPVSGRRDWLVVDAVRGLGEALVSGEVTPDHVVLDAAFKQVTYDRAGDEPVLSDPSLDTLARHARDAEARVGAPLDLEWAIDGAGRVVFLQARPITHLAADPRALDLMQSPSDFYTKCNIGEMMPGAITPLSRSLTAYGIEVSMQRMYVKCGALAAETPEHRFVAVFSGHMFLNLTGVLGISTMVAGSTPDQACLAICGQRVEAAERALPPPASAFVQYRNLLKYAAFIMGAGKRVPAMRRSVADLEQVAQQLPQAGTASAMWTRIDAALPVWFDVFEHHLACSSPAGAMAPVLLRVTAKSDPPDAQDIARVAELLSGATDVESADIAAGIDHIVEALAKLPDARERFLDAELEDALAWLQSPAAGHAAALFSAYLERHGHRTVRELEIHQRDWSDDPLPLLRSMRSALRARTSGASATAARTRGAPLRDREPLSRGLRALVRRAHDAVRLRETTKSLLVKAGQQLKRAYRTLGAALAAEGLLPDADAVFFLTHQELRRCLDGDAALADLAVARRKSYAYQMDLIFEEIFVGRPEPVRPTFDAGDEVVLGKPVSVGVARGRARVVRTLEEASLVEAGEILIAPITDVGWTPYFGLLGGLATDVGSAVSHGAVVAREYGVPCIVGTQHGTSMFRTGDRVELDGSTGRLRLLRDDE
jgi:pyruvate,water dikinase